MKRTVTRDPFFDRQPDLSFIEDLKQPLHATAPAYYGQRTATGNEFNANGLYIAEKYPEDPDGLLDTVYADLDRFFKVYGIGGSRYPIHIVKGETQKFEAYVIEMTAEGITVTANDTEGVRRALIFIEDELRRREGAFLEPCTISRAPHIRSRITRCFFSPINRPPKYGDELSDEIDYYPEEYLKRLMHDGANGVWIYTRFSDILPSSYIDENGKGFEKRIAKLNAVIEKCRRYGIGVYVFAIEPVAFTPEAAKKYPGMCGVPHYDRVTFCANSDMGKAYCLEAGEQLMKLAPKLAGFISITYGERTTSCSSAADFTACPRCGKKHHGEVVADAVEALRAGIRTVNPACETISWTYGARARMMHAADWHEDIRDYVRCAPDDVMLMQNFDDMGYEEQLGECRQGEDYWLSYIGPSELFRYTAEQAKRFGKHMFAKMQVCCSHEIASVPYVPVPGILFKKYQAAHALGVEGVMQCWYFGNYPSLMSKAAGELAFETFSSETDFLTRLAGIYWGRSKAPTVVKAWQTFEEAYRNYPLNIMFSYYGPAHDGVVWKLALKPKNFSLARTWQGLDPVDGDRIGEALLNGHTLEEALTLVDRMCRDWADGTKLLHTLSAENEDELEQQSAAEAIRLLFDSAHNILLFYHLREKLGYRQGDPQALLSRMRSIVQCEMENSRAMISLCQKDGRLGYHSEAEGYKFFPAKLRDRIQQLQTLLETEFVEVAERIALGRIPLEYYDGVDDTDGVKQYVMGEDLSTAPWESIDDTSRSCFRMAYDDKHIYIELMSDEKVSFTLAPEFRLLHPDAVMHIHHDGTLKLGDDAFLYNSLFCARETREYAKYRRIHSFESTGTHLLLTLCANEIGMDCIRPFKLKIRVGNVSWCHEEDPTHTLGKSEISPNEFGWILPSEKDRLQMAAKKV